MADTSGSTGGPDGLAGPIVDCDIHHTYRSPEEVAAYLPKRYRNRGFELPGRLWANPGGVLRTDVTTSDGGEPGSTVANVTEQLLDPLGIDAGILTGDVLSVSTLPNRDYAAELALAYNRWNVDTWLTDTDERLYGSIVIAPQHPERAAETIREFGDHPRMVQVIMNSVSRDAYGAPFYRPIFEAAADLDLPVAIHPHNQGSGISNPPSSVGYPASYFEWHNIIPVNLMAQLNSLICEGVFEAFPELRFICVEGGFGWVPHLMWRMDKNWKGLRDQAPWLQKAPSEYVLDNVWFTTQPMEEPEHPRHLDQLLEMMHAERTLLFSSDYPHWDGDDLRVAFRTVDDDLKRRIFVENAREVYGLTGL